MRGLVSSLALLASISVASAQVVEPVNAPSAIGQTHVPLILPSSGSMANNGALTITTALPATYANAYVSLPAGAIATGVPAAEAWYYAQCSSTTLCTVFNNVYTPGSPSTPSIPASPTPFVTTGPGAYTQLVATNFVAYQITLPAGYVDKNACVSVQGHISYNNSAGAKTLLGFISTYAFGSAAPTTSTQYPIIGGFCNEGVTNLQAPMTPQNTFLSNSVAVATTYGAIDMTAAQTLTIDMKIAVATDFLVLDFANIALMPIIQN